MAGRGPLPKSTGKRARRHGRHLRAVADVETPELPADLVDAWHPMVVRWWSDLWASPMAPEYLASDVHGLIMLAVLMHRYWTDPTPQLAAEIRLQRQSYGLSPTDRQRLRWEIDRGEAAETATARRRRAAITDQNALRSTPPARNAAKVTWIAWAVTHGASQAAAEAMTRQQLIDRYETAGSDPLAALIEEHDHGLG